ncbi:MAG: glycerol-3-phosphate responsive antiterminator [Oscillospiraceae bacterium]
MKQSEIIRLLEENPVIAAVKDQAGLSESLASSCKVVFILYGNVLDIADIVRQIHTAGKAAIVHIDLVDGLAARDIAVEFIAKNTEADGVISTKQSLVKRARELGLLSIRRFFLLDSMALQNIQKQLVEGSVDLIEVLPGIMPKILQKIVEQANIPVIAGGLITEKEDVVHALSVGAVAISTTNQKAWYF